MKKARHKAILELIKNNSIDKQEELLRLLQQEGYSVTQATVSRDIRELHLVKTPTGSGGFRYVTPFAGEKPRHEPVRFETIFRESVLKSDFAGHTVMVKCYSGMANAACEVFDSMVWSGVVGTLSGDDTFIVLMRTEEEAAALCRQLDQYIHPRRSE